MKIFILIAVSLLLSCVTTNFNYPRDFIHSRYFSVYSTDSENLNKFNKWKIDKIKEERINHYFEVKIGMSKDTVISMLGNPDYLNADTLIEEMIYEDFKNNTKFAVGIKNGRVIKTGSSSFSDLKNEINSSKQIDDKK